MAELLWQSEGAGDWAAPDLGPCPLTPTLDRMRWALVVCGATDPLRSDLRPAAVARAARRATAALTDVVGPRPGGEDAGRVHRGAARRPPRPPYDVRRRARRPP